MNFGAAQNGIKSALPLMSDPITKPATTDKNGASSGPQVNVFAVHGVEPEVQAYAMAKYSRSALSMKESLKEISEQKAEQFLNTFYFQYGHRSIADLAHMAFAIEKLSILAAIVLVDEQRWDGQERSTRYQNFKKSGYFIPDFGSDEPSKAEYCATVDFLFAEYDTFTQEMLRYYTGKIPRPVEMAEDQYTRTLRARAFDNSRYLLPLATNTSLGQIVNARTLETQIARLLSSPYAEVRHLGGLLKSAARDAAYNVQSESLRALVEEIKTANPELGAKAEQQLLRPTRMAPTLVKYAHANEYESRTRTEMEHAAAELMEGVQLEQSPKLVDLVEDGPLEVEIAATLLYSACHHSYRQVTKRVQALTGKQRSEIIDLGMRHRRPHDELLRSFHAGQQLKFDILMDVGGFRDMHRHRRCTQIEQGFTRHHGYDTPPDIVEAGLGERYKAAIERVIRASDKLGATDTHAGRYLLPMAFRKRTLFKMDFAEALYIAELRSGPAGHFSYRNVAYAMYEEVTRKHPSLAKYFRVTDVSEPIDLLKR
ncbi:MAG: alternative thymidylate synthase-like protein [Candidatus Angelobacter sp.]|nr:alternative thymidylate synthase-like protein [Candidatus Angelobacter sp.]